LTLDAFGRVDGRFDNAGSGGRRTFVDRTAEKWSTMFATNLDGVFMTFSRPRATCQSARCRAIVSTGWS
jgi:NAD(P)-dependent dehydrogenase (short-subunit alcohol dehydrogenase family)